MSTENTWQERIAAGRFAGKTIVVTGAGSGIGKATALRVAKEGGKVIAGDISAGRLEQLVAENPGLDMVVVTGDITEQEVADRVIAAGEGRFDGLANVAGIMDKFEPIHEVEDATWERVFNVNVNSILKLTRSVLPLMLDAGHGAVVNVAWTARLGCGSRLHGIQARGDRNDEELGSHVCQEGDTVQRCCPGRGADEY